MTRRPRLHPNHQHQWTDILIPGPQVACTICGLTMPRAIIDSLTPTTNTPIGSITISRTQEPT